MTIQMNVLLQLRNVICLDESEKNGFLDSIVLDFTASEHDLLRSQS